MNEIDSSGIVTKMSTRDIDTYISNTSFQLTPAIQNEDKNVMNDLTSITDKYN